MPPMIHGEMPRLPAEERDHFGSPAEWERGGGAGDPLAGDAPGQVDGELGGLSPCRRRQAGHAQMPVLGEDDAWSDQLGQLPGAHVVGVGDREHLRDSSAAPVSAAVHQSCQLQKFRPAISSQSCSSRG
jgi:hypothetical protein